MDEKCNHVAFGIYGKQEVVECIECGLEVDQAYLVQTLNVRNIACETLREQLENRKVLDSDYQQTITKLKEQNDSLKIQLDECKKVLSSFGKLNGKLGQKVAVQRRQNAKLVEAGNVMYSWLDDNCIFDADHAEYPLNMLENWQAALEAE